MTSINPTTFSGDELAPMLRAWAGGALASEAAVELVIAHRTWLRRADFKARLVDAVDDGWGPGGSVVPMAAIDWELVPEFLNAALVLESLAYRFGWHERGKIRLVSGTFAGLAAETRPFDIAAVGKRGSSTVRRG
jgi:hypothetical protein